MHGPEVHSVSDSSSSLLCALGAAALFSIGCQGSTIPALELRPEAPRRSTPQLLRYARDAFGRTSLGTFASRISSAETLPFDGVILDMGMEKVWLHGQIVEAAFAPQLDILRTFPLHKLVANFQMLAIDNIDWSDDLAFANVLTNLRTVASLAKAAGLKGIFLDTQQYENNIFWNCGGQAGGFASCEELLKRRGQQFMSSGKNAGGRGVLDDIELLKKLLRSGQQCGRSLQHLFAGDLVDRCAQSGPMIVG